MSAKPSPPALPVLDRTFSTRLQAWFSIARAAFPWRIARTPYSVWVSEVILQQTRTQQGLDYYQHFLAAFPNVESLALATEAQVLRVWEGLGYYSRARNLWKAARYVVEQLGGIFPSTYAGWLELPGVGPYTAAAVLSIAYGQPYAVVDGNVHRVLSRHYAIGRGVDDAAGKAYFNALAQELLDPNAPGTHNEALMELGRLVCKPQSPLCEKCPLQMTCIASQTGSTASYPIRNARTVLKDRYLHYLVLGDEEGAYLQLRENKDVWRGLYEFVLLEGTGAEGSPPSTPLTAWLKRQGMLPLSPTRTHIHLLTHQRLHLFFYRVSLTGELPEKLIRATNGLTYYSHEAIANLPKPVPVRKFWEHFRQMR